MKTPFSIFALAVLIVASAVTRPTRGAYVDPMSPPEVNAFVNAQQAQWRPVLEAFGASIKK